MHVINLLSDLANFVLMVLSAIGLVSVVILIATIDVYKTNKMIVDKLFSKFIAKFDEETNDK